MQSGKMVAQGGLTNSREKKPAKEEARAADARGDSKGEKENHAGVIMCAEYQKGSVGKDRTES